MLIVGGSLGAEAINQVIHASIDRLASEFVVIHVCGKGNIEERLRTIEHYYQFEYIDEQWGDVLALADIVVSRAGANALFELLTLGKPNVLIPLPLAQSRGDQLENAEMAETNGWSLVLPEERCSKESLPATIDLISGNLAHWQKKLKSFTAQDSTNLIVAEIDRVLR